MSRRLYRSRTDSVLGGVAGGVAEYLDADPAIVRIIWAILAIVTGGIFLVLYIVMWIVVPETPVPTTVAPVDAAPGATVVEGPAEVPRRGSGSGAMVFGLILVGLGAYFLIDEYLPQVDVSSLWPIGLVVLGLALLVNSLRGRSTQ
ncbi:MAG TPA: PspC domain-containing protein [Candidatus Dormibacteraeota bacterium]|nr:PspC domain-containing protein [Candidatus Dormibacteraeota bacterium]